MRLAGIEAKSDVPRRKTCTASTFLNVEMAEVRDAEREATDRSDHPSTGLVLGLVSWEILDGLGACLQSLTLLVTTPPPACMT